MRRTVRQNLALELPPALGVSRQPVRHAFYRLSKFGVLHIRPRKPTMVSAIPKQAVMCASFVRTAIEIETARMACERLSALGHAALDLLLERQRSGHGYAWEVIREHKAQMDRVRFLWLSFNLRGTLSDHESILEAIRARNVEQATSQFRFHLSRIASLITRGRADHGQFFENQAVAV